MCEAKSWNFGYDHVTNKPLANQLNGKGAKQQKKRRTAFLFRVSGCVW
jgi:hypothetical protein